MRQDTEDWATRYGHDSRDLDQVKKALLEADDAPYREWNPLLKQAISEAQGKCVPRTLYQLPVGFRWEHRRGVTLIGDAATS